MESDAASREVRALTDKLFIDECLSVALVAVAKNLGIIAEYGPYIGKGGWQDWNIVPFVLANDYIIVTNNRRHSQESPHFFSRTHKSPILMEIARRDWKSAARVDHAETD